MYPKFTKVGLSLALSLGLCVGTGVAGASADTVSTGTSFTAESSSLSPSSDVRSGSRAELKLIPAELTIPAGGKAQSRTQAWHHGPDPVCMRASYSLGEVPAGITAHISAAEDSMGQPATITVAHTGKTTARVAHIPITVRFGADTDTQLLKVHLPSGDGNSDQPLPAPVRGTYIDDLGSDVRGKIDATSVAKAGVTSEVVDGNRLTLGITAQHPCFEAVGITVVTPDGRRHTLKRAANNPTRCTPWSGESTANYRVRMKTDAEWKLELSSTSTDIGQLEAFRVSLDTM